MKKILLLLTVIGSVLVSQTNAKVILNLKEDFDPLNMPQGLAFMWNPEDIELGNSSKYQKLQLIEKSKTLVADVDNPPGPGSSATNANWLKTYRLTPYPNMELLPDVEYDVIRMSPGNSASNSTDQLDHYIILAYTIQPGEAGTISIKHSRIYRIFKDEFGKLSIYINDQLLGADELHGNDPMSIDLTLGELAVGDTIYLALGPGEMRSIGYTVHLQLFSE